MLHNHSATREHQTHTHKHTPLGYDRVACVFVCVPARRGNLQTPMAVFTTKSGVSGIQFKRSPARAAFCALSFLHLAFFFPSCPSALVIAVSQIHLPAHTLFHFSIRDSMSCSSRPRSKKDGKSMTGYFLLKWRPTKSTKVARIVSALHLYFWCFVLCSCLCNYVRRRVAINHTIQGPERFRCPGIKKKDKEEDNDLPAIACECCDRRAIKRPDCFLREQTPQSGNIRVWL